VNLEVVGKGPNRSELESIVDERGLQDHVRFHGFVSEQRKIELLNQSDIFVYASTYESFGIVILEAMAASLAVVAISQPAYSDFFSQPRNGYLVSSPSSKAISEKVEYLLDNPDVVSNISENNRLDAKEYSWDSVSNEMVSLLNQV
jgi:glycosyltransferase involved in cell wall biosynthesis